MMVDIPDQVFDQFADTENVDSQGSCKEPKVVEILEFSEH